MRTANGGISAPEKRIDRAKNGAISALPWRHRGAAWRRRRSEENVKLDGISEKRAHALAK